VFQISIWRDWSFLGGAKPTKTPVVMGLPRPRLAKMGLETRGVVAKLKVLELC